MSPLRAVDAYEIICDEEGCYAYTPPAYGESLAEEDGFSQGWQKVGENTWFCPEHKTDEP